MKKYFGTLCAVVAAGCAVTFAGCAPASNSTGGTATNSNWYTSTGYSGIQPTFVEGNANFSKEEIEYEISFEKPVVQNLTYSVEYYLDDEHPHYYKTEFYAKQFSWDMQNIPEGYKNDAVSTEILYYFKTEMRISGKYVYTANGFSSEFENVVETECYFRPAENKLKPVYSKQTAKSATPINITATENVLYMDTECSYETFYNFEFTECTTVVNESRTPIGSAGKGETEKKQYNVVINKLNESKSVFDNSSLYVAIRSFSLADKYSHSINVVLPASKKLNSYTVSGSENSMYPEEENMTEQQKNERAKIVAEMKEKNLLTGDNLETVCASITYNGELSGAAQRVWYAKGAVTTPDNNKGRSTMIKISAPLSYNLGTLNYTLKNIVSTLWNG